MKHEGKFREIPPRQIGEFAHSRAAQVHANLDTWTSLDTDLTRNTRAPHFTPQHWLLCHMGLC